MTESSDCAKARRIISWLCRRLAWLITTPLGAAVEPEVYCRKAGAPASIGGGLQEPAGSPSSSVASQRSERSSGAAAQRLRRRGRAEEWVRTTAGRASRTIDSSRPRVRRDPGGYTGTAITPL